MSNEQLEYWIPDYITGKLDAESASAVERRIDADPAFRQEYLEMKQVMGVLQENKAAQQTPPGLNNLLVGVNQKLDEGQQSYITRIFRPRFVIPAALALQVLTIVLLISVYAPNENTPILQTQELHAALEDVDYTQLTALQDNLSDDFILPDLPVNNEDLVVDADLSDDFNDVLQDELFADVTYEEVLAASHGYLSDDELLGALQESTVAELIKEVNDKPLL